MKILARFGVFLGLAGLLVTISIASQGENAPNSTERQDGMPGMNMGGTPHESDTDREAAKSINDAMSDHDMGMSAHMFMTDLRPHSPADSQRAAQIVQTVQKSIAQYRDYKTALANGFRIFMPNVPQPIYHFTNYGYGYMAQFKFDPALPTSLLYKKTPDGYQLVGAMYTAPRGFTEDQLDERVPLSVARWHKHVNFCLPPKGQPISEVNWSEFGFAGSIATQDACQQAGGRWIPQVFNWMVHVYPFETDPNKIWAH